MAKNMRASSSTLLDKLATAVKQFSDQTALQVKQENGYKEYSFVELHNRSREVAESLSGLGINPGDRVAIAVENCPEWVFIYFGVLFAGAVAVPIDPSSSFDDYQYFLAHSESKVIFTSNKYSSTICSAIEKIKSSVVVVLIDSDVKGSSLRNSVVTFPAFLSGKKRAVDDITTLPEDLASIVYTSGTTSQPKGVMLSHENFCANFTSIERLEDLSCDYKVLAILPLHHVFPFMCTVLMPIFLGGTATYLKKIDQVELMQSMREAGITIFVSVPQYFFHFYNNILERFNKLPFVSRILLKGIINVAYQIRKLTGFNLIKILFPQVHEVFGKSLRYFVSGGARLDSNVELGLNKFGFTLIQGYGLTEAAPVVTFNPIKQPKVGSVGQVIPDVKVKIINQNVDGIGEVVISGANVMQGYYKLEQETNEALQDGWFYTGDLGYFDKNGYLLLTGRKKELIVLSSGKNISPEEVESHYAKGSYIKELCVLGIDQDDQEKLAAVVVPDFECFKKTGEIDIYNTIKLEIEIYSKDYPAYKSIVGFVVTKEELPRTRLGKLKRHEIRAKYLNELLYGESAKPVVAGALSQGDMEILGSTVYRQVSDVILQEKQQLKSPLNLEDHLGMDLGFDSLGIIELVAALERKFKIEIPRELLAKIATVKDLVLMVKQEAAENELYPVDTTDYSKLNLWQEILSKDPAQEIIDKTDLRPTWLAKFIYLSFCKISWLIAKLTWRLQAQGLENLPQDTPVVLCPNHTSFLDAFLVLAVLPTWLQKNIFFMGYHIYFDTFIVRNFIKLSRVIPIDPATNLVDAMQACSYVLKNDKFLCIFPEGNRSVHGKLQPFKKGVGILAQELDVKLVPVYIDGAFAALPRGKKFPSFNQIKIHFGKPCAAKDLKAKGNSLGVEDSYEAIIKGLEQEYK